MITAGIDIGALAIKVVILNGDSTIKGWAIAPTGIMSLDAVQACLDKALNSAEVKEDDLDYTVSTGYGRRKVPLANRDVTEITCHARGVHFLFPEVHTIVDIGGQDSKAILIGDKGQVVNFEMNDKCAAGSGRFLEVMARSLGVNLEDMGELSLKAKQDVQISSICTVFAETEVISLLASGCAKEDILSGIHYAISRRVSAMVKHVGMTERVAMSGGVAKNIGVVRALESILDTTLLIPPEPQIVGALGAALIALEGASVAV